ncbi:conjugal transfer protein [Paraburkholderia azotifigens]|uniref:Conjugal transfer protein n=1 Tax=Paraburkholderia azotifigens TaxID=2057004 RepID=A0A5C6VK61_9BURK|nr:conjugal transfer protein [Paraburkholderia azotifigens]TXC85480.1 conjugal transfer protein [Paraburkholderia azotifigens]
MKKALSSVLALLLGLSATTVASASSCESLICMAGKVQGQSGGDDCNQAIKDFFSIKRYHHGHLDLGRQAMHAGSFLINAGLAAERKQRGRDHQSVRHG